MPETDVEDLVNNALKSIVCENVHCDQPGVLMGRGCPEEAYVAVCEEHYQWIRDLFDSVPPCTICAGCLRLMIYFEQHFSIVWI